MATVKTDNTGKAMLVVDASTKLPIDLPLNAQEKIMTPIVYLKEWIKKRQRTGGIGKMLPGGKIKYYAYPKQTTGRDLEITYDDQTGKINGGIFGAADSDNMIGGIKKTFGSTLVSDEITLNPAKFLKHSFANSDAKEEGLGTLIANKLADWTAEIAEEGLVDLKKAHVEAFGTIGKWAKDKGYIAPTKGIGKRIQSKDYTVDAAGGLQAKNDIVETLIYRDKIGLKDGVEKDYPLARGMKSSSSALISISSSINSAMLKAVEESKNGFISGIGVNTATGIVTSISYEGKTVSVEVIDDMPKKGGKEFNWSIEEIGKHGALALPNKWNSGSVVRPDTEALVLNFSVLEAIGLLQGLKYLQPELNFASFKAS